ncbi:MAG: type II toxin-antitoxin system VapC family toxin [Verrucomicrobia bacterium]|nr:type II toxin-antitoxin system VapC family toxin [Verrucomicrobiota bacterium]MDE3097902.1 type II toxin-antitoxin system VapC family toxin [Verrucomicrobiota bacterium]
MILVDTSVIVAWLDANHPQHRACLKAIEHWAQRDRLAVSAVTLGELAVGGCTRDAVEEDLRDFEILPLDANAAWRAGMAFRQYRRKESDRPVLPDFFIRAQAAALQLPHLTNDRRRIKSFPDVDFEFV